MPCAGQKARSTGKQLRLKAVHAVRHYGIKSHAVRHYGIKSQAVRHYGIKSQAVRHYGIKSQAEQVSRRAVCRSADTWYRYATTPSGAVAAAASSTG